MSQLFSGQDKMGPFGARVSGSVGKVPRVFGEGVILVAGPSPVIRHSKRLQCHFDGEGPRPKKRPSPFIATTFTIHSRNRSFW